MAVLTAVALIVFVIEAQIPLPVPVPGAKLGLANSVTLFALFSGNRTSLNPLRRRRIPGRPALQNVPQDAQCASLTKSGKTGARSDHSLSTADVFFILVCRIVLGAVFTGKIIAFAYSITGGLLAFVAQAVMKRFVTDKQIWACGAVGAVFHNIGQIAAAVLITRTPAIAAYLPVLIIAGVVTGIITGLVAQLTLVRLEVRGPDGL